MAARGNIDGYCWLPPLPVEAGLPGHCPRRDTWNTVDVDLGDSHLNGGVWRSEPGHWRIEMALGEHERERHHILTSPLSLYFCGAS